MHSIRYASPQDIPLIRELTFKVWPQTYSAIISKEQVDFMLEMMYSESSLEQQMNDGSRFIIVYDDETAVGFASFQHTGNGIYKLHKSYILASQQGKGTGRYAIEYIINEIKPEGGTALQLQVNRNNTARHFYTKLGFEVIEEADFDIGNGFYMNDYVMQKKI